MLSSKPQVKPTIEYNADFPALEPMYLAEKKAQIKEAVEEVVDTANFSGGLLIAKNGQILYENYFGFSSYKLGTSIKETTPLHLASVSKTLTATAILRLVDQGKIKLDMAVNEYLKDFPYPEITVRHLLNHRSGLQKYEYFTDSDKIWGRKKLLQNSDILALFIKHDLPLYFKPNSKFTYTNTNFAMLALIIEEITGKTYAKAMNDLVFMPLKMENTFVFNLKKDKYKRSQSYSSRYEKQPFNNLDAVYGDKNIYSTPRDILKYDLAMYNDDFLSANLKEEMYRGYSYERRGVNNYGLGIRLKEWENGSRLLYHHGWWHGNTSTYVTMKSDTVTIIGLSNKFSRRIYHLNKLSAIFRPQKGGSLIE
ncbi:MAG: beta-lactamase family protein [Bacteroidetes bacterium]|nr:beta-lactamase family protein [Bacteroidota bacterium]